jgi:Ser/Thr protein kinase RdoA (MazF antagonist)
MESLFAIAASPPACSPSAVAQAVAEQFGLAGDYAPLVSERDQNFRLVAEDGRCFVVKVTSRAEQPETSDFQLGALLYLEDAGVETPAVVRTLDGAAFGFIASPEGRHRLRVVTWIDGDCLLAAGINAERAAGFGEALARLDAALRGYTCPGENPVLLWDLQRAGDLRPLLPCIDDEEIRQLVNGAIDDFDAHVVPAALPVQAIHGDANPENVLVTGSGIAFIDFGDMVRAPRIFDVAIAAAYLRCTDGDDPLPFIRPFVAAYHAIAPLRDDESRLLFDLVRARLATTVTLLYWRLRDRPADDDYRRKSLQVERTASRFLAALGRMGRRRFDKEINKLLNP